MAYAALAVSEAEFAEVYARFARLKLATAISYARFAFSNALLAEEALAPAEY